MSSFPSDDSMTVVEKPRTDAAHPGLRSPIVALIAELQEAWKMGASPRVEPIFQRHPELRECPDAGLRLIYEEILQRRSQGEVVSLGELYNRFPHWHSQLSALVDQSQTLELPPNFDGGGFPSFEIIYELGRGSGGQVYLARQPTLCGRLVVLKVTPSEDMEHLTLARLQHTNIVPLYGVFDDPQGQRRALCMPYFGSTTLFHVFEGVRSIPIAKRRGSDIIDLLVRRESELPFGKSAEKHTTPAWAKEDYVIALCKMVAALAQALSDAHGRGLLHLDIKPSNVLVTVEGVPMLLDFHLARPPLAKGDVPPPMFGGSPPYMSPEQKSACDDVQYQRSIVTPLDARGDIYSLAMLLYVGLADEPPPESGGAREYLRFRNPHVSVGLADIVAKGISVDPADRYQDASHLAEDLRRHVFSEPLAHVPNRSWGERWSKWRRRRPYALPIIALAACLLTAIAASLYYVQVTVAGQRQSADTMYLQGQVHLQEKRFPQAIDAFSNARDILPSANDNDILKVSIDRGLAIARRAQQAKQVTDVVDEMRVAVHSEPIDYRTLIVLDVNGKAQWTARMSLLNDPSAPHDARLDAAVRRDLTELALDWADVHIRLAPAGREAAFRADAQAMLDEARDIAPSPRVIDWWLADNLDDKVAASSAWEWYALGRAYLRSGRLERAQAAFENSVKLEPAEYWSNFVLGVCAMKRGRPEEAVAAFSVCVGQRPLLDVPYVRRGEAQFALKQWDNAIRDFDRALQIRPNVTRVLVDRGRALIEAGQLDTAREDLQQALEQGAPVEIVQPLLDKTRNK